MDNQERQGPFRTSASLVLASASPRRKELMARLGLRFEVEASSAEELGPDSGLLPEDLVRQNGCLKANEVAALVPESLVIGADTCVALNGKIFGKPRDASDALEMLTSLAGKWHEVFTGFCISWPSRNVRIVKAVRSKVYIAGCNSQVLKSYCSTTEPLDKAGAYAVQGAGSFMVKEIVGSWTNVVGLPMTELIDVLLELEAIEPCARS